MKKALTLTGILTLSACMLEDSEGWSTTEQTETETTGEEEMPEPGFDCGGRTRRGELNDLEAGVTTSYDVMNETYFVHTDEISQEERTVTISHYFDYDMQTTVTLDEMTEYRIGKSATLYVGSIKDDGNIATLLVSDEVPFTEYEFEFGEIKEIDLGYAEDKVVSFSPTSAYGDCGTTVCAQLYVDHEQTNYNEYLYFSIPDEAVPTQDMQGIQFLAANENYNLVMLHERLVTPDDGYGIVRVYDGIYKCINNE